MDYKFDSRIAKRNMSDNEEEDALRGAPSLPNASQYECVFNDQ